MIATNKNSVSNYRLYKEAPGDSGARVKPSK
jgi:hypothetical protein